MDSAKGIGRYYPGVNASGGAMHRGGDFAQRVNSDILATALDMSPDSRHPSIDFRCRILLLFP